MPLIPWKPFFDLEKYFEEEDWFLPVFPAKELTKPAMDIYETDKEVVAELNIPGFDPEKIDVSIEKGILRVSGKAEEKKEEKKKDYYRKEIRRGSFERMVSLPAQVKEDEAQAIYEKGILKIVIPKAEVPKTPKVKIKIKEKK